MEEFSIEETNEKISMDLILSTFSKKSEAKKAREIKDALLAELVKDSDSLFSCQREAIEKQIDDLLRSDRKEGEASRLIYSKGKYKQRPNKMKPGGADVILQSKDFTGKAGECAVMSELLFRGYNVNRMMVDGGIDLVGFNEGSYYFYQVKTVSLNNGIVNASIPIENFERNKGYSSQMRYVIVVRYKDSEGVEKNHFFVFTQDDIEREMHNHCIKRGTQYISIKIRFHERTAKPILYDEKECDADWFHNNFK
ncbi:MAG: hypothetical protein J6K19_03725 [Prevotella sp.]|nr:hypothetical protein [Prevotella sp.]